MTDPEPIPSQHKLSEAAARALYDLKVELVAWPAWVESVTSSTVIELLTWWWKETHAEGKTEIKATDFRPKTRRGRKAGPNQLKNARRLE